MQHKHHILYLLLAISCFACEQKPKKFVDPEMVDLIADFYLKYEKQKETLSGNASIEAGDFREHGVPAKLNGSMKLNNIPFKEKKVKRKYLKYNAAQKVPIPEEYHIEIQLDNGKSTEIKLPLNPIDDFYLSKSRFSDNESIVVSWSGPKLKEGETILVYFEDSEGNKKPWRINGPTEKKKIYIPNDIIYTLQGGKGIAYLTRRIKYKKIHEWLDYQITTEFYTKEVPFELYEE